MAKYYTIFIEGIHMWDEKWWLGRLLVSKKNYWNILSQPYSVLNIYIVDKENQTIADTKTHPHWSDIYLNIIKHDFGYSTESKDSFVNWSEII